MVAQAVRRSELRDEIANALAVAVKAYDSADVCVELGMAPKGENEEPSSSKRMYVGARVRTMSMDELVALGRKVVEDYESPELQRTLATIDQAKGGVAGELKNIIFAADGPKPRIVLRDALNNRIEIVEHADKCLVYDEPLLESGLSWSELVAWWRTKTDQADRDDRAVALDLYGRLRRSLANDAENFIMHTYGKLYATAGFDIPALIPQVYLHYDPYTKRELGSGSVPALTRQRMDFLLLFPHRVRVVLELDGREHYADGGGKADPRRYAAMVAQDRALRLAGYEVYRFGGQELADRDSAAPMLTSFFESLLTRHEVSLIAPVAPAYSDEPPF